MDQINKFTPFLILILLSAFQIDAAVAQQVRGGGGYAHVGTMWSDFSALDNRLDGLGMTSVSDNQYSIGGGGHFIINNWVIGGEGHGLYAGSQSYRMNGADAEYELGGGYGLFYVGRVVWTTDHLIAYPTLGIGGGGYELRATQDEGYQFDDQLQNPSGQSTMSLASTLIDIGVSADRFISGRSGLALGLKLGYLFSPGSSGWEIEGSEVAGSPDSRIQGFYIRLKLGGGGFGQ